MKKSIIVVLVLIGLVAYSIYDNMDSSSPVASNQEDHEELETIETGIQKGQLAPELELLDLEGNTVKLSDYKGKIVFVNFWATWCPPCQAEMPHMQKFYEDYASKDVAILGVNLTPTEKSKNDIYTFVDDEKLTFPIVLDEEGDTMLAYRVVAYPTTYLLDARGVIQEKFVGPISYEIMKNVVNQLQ